MRYNVVDPAFVQSNHFRGDAAINVLSDDFPDSSLCQCLALWTVWRYLEIARTKQAAHIQGRVHDLFKEIKSALFVILAKR